jgi:hypothetical protein
MSLLGITRRSLASRNIPNPLPHLPLGLQNRVMLEVRGPNGKLKKRVEKEGNYMVDYGLSRVAALMATGTYSGSLFAGGLALGTGTTAATNNQTALVASTVGAGTFTPAVSGVSMNYAGSFASGVTGVISEIGLFQSSAAFSASMIARLVLTGTQIITLGVSDTVNATYQVVAKTAA